jgi:hypothetical protein
MLASKCETDMVAPVEFIYRNSIKQIFTKDRIGRRRVRCFGFECRTSQGRHCLPISGMHVGKTLGCE